jgi:hypothetical protein
MRVERGTQNIELQGFNGLRDRNGKLCREDVQNARSLKLSGTCNVKKRFFHRVFHSNCGKVGGGVAEG